jgi:hypothetical protein
MATLDSAGRIDRDTSYAVRPGQRLLSDHETAFKDPQRAHLRPGPECGGAGARRPPLDNAEHARHAAAWAEHQPGGRRRDQRRVPVAGHKHTSNSWIVTVPGFFGQSRQATLTAVAVSGTTPAVVTGDEAPISNIVSHSSTMQTEHYRRVGSRWGPATRGV